MNMKKGRTKMLRPFLLLLVQRSGKPDAHPAPVQRDTDEHLHSGNPLGFWIRCRSVVWILTLTKWNRISHGFKTHMGHPKDGRSRSAQR